MSIQRKKIDAVKAEAQRLLQRIDELERCAGWDNFDTPGVRANHRTAKPGPNDVFNYGQHTAAVKRASMDLSRALVPIRR